MACAGDPDTSTAAGQPLAGQGPAVHRLQPCISARVPLSSACCSSSHQPVAGGNPPTGVVLCPGVLPVGVGTLSCGGGVGMLPVCGQ